MFVFFSKVQKYNNSTRYQRKWLFFILKNKFLFLRNSSVPRKAEILRSEGSTGLCCLFGISLFVLNNGSGLCVRDHRYNALVELALVELNGSVDECKQSVILTDGHVVTRIVLRTALANDDVTSQALLTSENLDAESLSCALATVLRTTYTFFMSHF